MAFPKTPSSVDPGSKGALSWKGLNWTKRSGGAGGPGVSPWVPGNVVHNDDDTLTFRLTSAGGCEIDTTRKGFGYGDYWISIATPLHVMGHGVTWGALFTYDSGEPTGSHNEIDVQETSSWGGSGVPVTNPHHWAAGTKQVPCGADFAAHNGPTCTHMRWEKGRLSFWSYAGLDDSAPLLKTASTTTNVPVPRQENLVINLWQFSGGIQPIDITVHDFAFIPQGTVVPPTPPAPAPPVSTGLPSDLATGATLADVVAGHNALLDHLRAKGL